MCGETKLAHLQLCNVCTVAEIGREAVGMRVAPFQFK